MVQAVVEEAHLLVDGFGFHQDVGALLPEAAKFFAKVINGCKH